MCTHSNTERCVVGQYVGSPWAVVTCKDCYTVLETLKPLTKEEAEHLEYLDHMVARFNDQRERILAA